MNRRAFLGFGLAATGGVFAPRFGRWYREQRIVVPHFVVTMDGVVVARIPEGAGLVHVEVGTVPSGGMTGEIEGRWAGVVEPPHAYRVNAFRCHGTIVCANHTPNDLVVKLPMHVGRAPKTADWSVHFS